HRPPGGLAAPAAPRAGVGRAARRQGPRRGTRRLACAVALAGRRGADRRLHRRAAAAAGVDRVSHALATRAAALDRDHPLREVRHRFVLPAGLRYFDGNSLGALADGVATRVQAAVQAEWGQHLIGSWNRAWIDLPRRVAEKLAPFLGVAGDEVAVADGTSV